MKVQFFAKGSPTVYDPKGGILCRFVNGEFTSEDRHTIEVLRKGGKYTEKILTEEIKPPVIEEKPAIEEVKKEPIVVMSVENKKVENVPEIRTGPSGERLTEVIPSVKPNKRSIK